MMALLVNKVICAFLLDVVGMSEQPDDLVTSKRESHEDKESLGKEEKKKSEKILYLLLGGRAQTRTTHKVNLKGRGQYLRAKQAWLVCQHSG